MATRVITIARQLGSYGDELGTRLSQELGIPLLAQEVLELAAQQAGVSLETVAAAERVPSWTERLLDAISQSGSMEPGGLESLNPPVTGSTLDRMTTSSDARRIINDVVRGLASRGACVIVGHAAQVALEDVPGVLHIYVHAPEDVRIQRIAAERGITADQAKHLVRADDKQRSELFTTFYNVRWDDPELYAVTLNTGVLDLDAATQIVMTAATKLVTVE